MARSTHLVLSSALVSVVIFNLPSVAFAGWHQGDPVPLGIAGTPGVPTPTFSLPVSELQLLPCGGGNIVHQAINATVSSNTGLVVPLGCWQEISIIQSGDFTLSGLTPTSHTLTMSIGTGPIELVMDHDLEVVSGGSTEDVWIELLAPDWYADELDPYVSSQSNVTVTSSHSRYPYLQDSLGLGSAMHMD